MVATSMKRIACGLLAIPLVMVAGVPAAGAQTYSPETYDFTIPYTLSNFINYNEYTIGSPGISYQIGSFPPGVGTYTENISSLAGDVTLTTLMGTSALDSDSPNHLVVAVSPTFYQQYVGNPLATDRSFNTVFNTGIQESDVVAALNTINNPGSTDTGPAFDTLFDFAGVMKSDGATFAPNGAFDFVSFSDGALFGTGTATFVPFASGVPEPATWAMMLLGFGAVGFGLRYRRKRTAVSFA